MVLAILIVAVLLLLTVLLHYEGLRTLFLGVPKIASGQREKLLLIIFGVIVLHLIEIALYGVGYWFGDVVVDIGEFAGRAVTFRDYLYFSAETYTTLGLGDIYPVGDLRLIASIESLNGLLLLGWSASFTYLAMQKYWEGDRSKN
jgi:Ion channel